MRTFMLCLAAVLAGATIFSSTAEARWPPEVIAARQAQRTPWHGPYYHTEYGAPVALVVPPTAQTETRFSWGVAMTTRYPIWHQFGRAGGYAAGDGGMLLPTPRWPSHTDQFGVYYVRGPWGHRY